MKKNIKQKKYFNYQLIRTFVALFVLNLLVLINTGCTDRLQSLANEYGSTTSKTYSSATFAPDGRIVAYRYTAVRDNKFDELVSFNSDIVIMDQDGSNEEVLISENGNFEQIQVSPSMNYVAKHDNSRITVWNMNTKEKLNTFSPVAGVIKFDWSPDEKLVALFGADNNLLIYDPFSGEQYNNINIKVGNYIAWKYKEKIAFSDRSIGVDGNLAFILPDGEGYVTTSVYVLPLGYDKNEPYLYDHGGGLYVFNVNTLQGEQVYSYSHATTDNYKFVKNISPDGHAFLMMTSDDYGIWIKNIDGTGFTELR